MECEIKFLSTESFPLINFPYPALAKSPKPSIDKFTDSLKLLKKMRMQYVKDDDLNIKFFL